MYVELIRCQKSLCIYATTVVASHTAPINRGNRELQKMTMKSCPFMSQAQTYISALPSCEYAVKRIIRSQPIRSDPTQPDAIQSECICNIIYEGTRLDPTEPVPFWTPCLQMTILYCYATDDCRIWLLHLILRCVHRNVRYGDTCASMYSRAFQNRASPITKQH